MSSKHSAPYRLCFWLLLVAFAGLTVWWVLHIPYDEKALQRAVPREATLVSRHERLAARATRILANPLVAALAARQGLDAETEIQPWLDLFAARTTIVAFTPRLGAVRHPVWTVASWVGGRSLALRLGLGGLGKRWGLRRMRLDDGSSLWVEDVQDGDPDAPRVSLAVMDGVLFGCLSRDPMAARWLLYQKQGRIPLSGPPAFALEENPERPPAPDRGWLAGGAAARIAEVRYRLRELTATAVEGDVEMVAKRPLRQASGGGDAQTLLAIRRDGESMFGRAPDLFMAARFGAVRDEARRAGWTSVLENIELALPELGAETQGFVALYGGEASGRLLGLRVPTLLVGLRLAEEEGLVERIDAALDRLNARNGWGLIPRPVGDARQPVVVIDTTRGGLYSGMKETERPALTRRGDYLLLASNLRGLRELVDAEASGATPPRDAQGLDPRGVWLPGGRVPPAADACVQADLQRSGQSIKDALAVASLGLLVKAPPGGGDLLERLAAARSYVDLLQTLDAGVVWLDSSAGTLRAEVRLERRQQKP